MVKLNGKREVPCRLLCLRIDALMVLDSRKEDPLLSGILLNVCYLQPLVTYFYY